MPDQIEITRNTVAGGKAVFVGQVFTVEKTISKKDASILLSMRKAIPFVSNVAKKPIIDDKTIVDPSDEPPIVENREDDLQKTVVKRAKKTKKSKK